MIFQRGMKITSRPEIKNSHMIFYMGMRTRPVRLVHATQEPAGKSQEGPPGLLALLVDGPPAPPGFFPRVSVTFSVGMKFHWVRKIPTGEISKGHEKISAFPFEKPQAKVPSTFGYSRGKARERLPP